MSPWTIEIQPLHAGHRHALQLHLMGLDAADRHARFGATLGDAALLAWVRQVEWASHGWWGAWSPAADAGLLGALQLTPTRHAGTCELALTVNPAIRRRGVATALLQTAVAARAGAGLATLVCQHGHPAVLRMAQTLGYAVRRQDAEPRLWLALPGGQQR